LPFVLDLFEISTDDAQRRCAAEPRRASALSSSSIKPPSFICHRALTSFRADTDECIPSARQRPFHDDDSDIFLLLPGNVDDPLRRNNNTPRFSLSFLRLSDDPDDDDSAHRLRILVALGLGVTSSTAAAAAAASSASRLSIALAAFDSGLRLLPSKRRGRRRS